MGLILFLIATAAVGAVSLAVWARYWPYAPCPACREHQGGRGRGRWSKPYAYNRCRRCGGSSERVRPLSRIIWPKWRREAKRRSERIKEARRR